MKNVIKVLCLLLASEVFAQEVNSEFLWSASEDSTERVITGKHRVIGICLKMVEVLTFGI